MNLPSVKILLKTTYTGGLWQHRSRSPMMKSHEITSVTYSDDKNALTKFIFWRRDGVNIQLKRYYLGVRRIDGVNSLLCNGNSQSSGLIIRRSAKSSRCFSGGVASWSSDALVENSSALAAPFKRLCWELIVEHKSFTAVLNYALDCSAQKKAASFFSFFPAFPC